MPKMVLISVRVLLEIMIDHVDKKRVVRLIA